VLVVGATFEKYVLLIGIWEKIWDFEKWKGF
jgi:hypothetical protein